MAHNDGESMKLTIRSHFGEGSVATLDRLLSMNYRAHARVPPRPHAHHQSCKPNFAEVMPHGAVFLLAGLLQPAVQASGAAADGQQKLVLVNATATVRALTRPSRWNDEASSAFAQRLLQTREEELTLLAAPGGDDYAALRFLAEIVQKNLSAVEVARALGAKGEGQRCMKTFHTSQTLGAVVMYASGNVFDDIGDWFDDVLDWLKGAAQWVVDAVEQFGEWACKQAKAVVDSVFSQFENATEILEQIPGVGLVVAGIYAMAGDGDQAMAALAINVNAIVTLIGAGVGFWLGGPAGSMAGGALGKAVGLLIQEAIAQGINDPQLRAKVGDISATRFIIEVALAGAAYGGAAGIGEVLATTAGMNAFQALATSVGLATLISKLPLYFVHKALD